VTNQIYAGTFVVRRSRDILKKTFMEEMLLSFFQNLGLLHTMNSVSMLIAVLIMLDCST
jgi:hypothetical protein